MQTFLDYAWKHFPFCQWCGVELEREEATMDHKYPISKGGSNRWRNRLISCHSCNVIKADSPPPNWRPLGPPNWINRQYWMRWGKDAEREESAYYSMYAIAHAARMSGKLPGSVYVVPVEESA